MKLMLLGGLFSFVLLMGVEAQIANVNWYDYHAHALCAAHGVHQETRGWVFTMRRQCGSGGSTSPSCAQLCAAAREQDPQTANRPIQCLGGVHVYDPDFSAKFTNEGGQPDPNNPAPGQFFAKDFIYNGCVDLNCGPNYCCCFAEQ